MPTATLLAMTLLAGGAGPGTTGDAPNVVLFLADDQGWADIGVYGARGFETPNLDALAARGVRFSQFYVSQAVCSASRASVLTGCYSNRVGVYGAYFPGSRDGLHPDEQTLGELLQDAGYATIAVGKWHLGHALPAMMPTAQGFDEYHGLLYSNDMWPVWYDGEPATNWKADRYKRLELYDGVEVVDYVDTLEDQGELTRLATERAVDFIERTSGGGSPMFVYVPYSMPHVPLGVSERWAGSAEQGRYGEVIQEIDWSVGEVLAALERAGELDNTLVIYTSDNGPWLNYGTHAGSPGPLREGKGTMFEGGARVPCIMAWPGRIPEGVLLEQVGATIDLVPTIAEITGASLPERPIDGVSLAGLITGEAAEGPRDEYAYYYGRQLQAVRKGDWKLHLPHRHRTYVGMTPGEDGFPGPTGTGRVSYDLFNLAEDPGERRNVSDLHPEVVEELKALAESYRERLGDAERAGSEQRPAGRAPDPDED